MPHKIISDQPATWDAKGWRYNGDMNPEHGGAWIDVSTFLDEYCDAVRVYNMEDADGWRGAVLIEHVVINIPDKIATLTQAMATAGLLTEETAVLLAFLEALRDDPDNRDAFEDWLAERDGAELLHRVAQALLDYGCWEPDDLWDGPGRHWSEYVQCESDGPAEYDGLTADVVLSAGATLEDYLSSCHLAALPREFRPDRQIRELTLGGPGLSGYVYNADVYCVDCGQDIIRRLCSQWPGLSHDDTEDSATCPYPIFFGESPDCPQHCAECGEYLYGADPEETAQECEECGSEMDRDCSGGLRCPECDGPCPQCSDQ